MRARDDVRTALGDDAVVLEALSKIYHGIGSRMYDAPTPILTRAFRGRRLSGTADDAVSGDDDDDDDDIDEVEEVPLPVDEPADGDIWALREVSLRIPRGAAVAVVGGPDAGKTTLLRVLSGVAPPSSGRAIVCGRTTPLLSRALHFLLPIYSPLQNVNMYASLASISRRTLRPHLDDVFALLDMTAKERRAAGTSDTKAVAVATALNIGADVLLLDEPFDGARERFRRRCVDVIQERRYEGTTLLLETGDRDLQRELCDRAVWLDDGTVAAEGGVDEMLAAYDASVRRRGSPPSRDRP